MVANVSLSRKPILFCKRLVSMTRIWDKLARASRSSTNPIGMRSGCSRVDVVSGTIRQPSGPKPRSMTHGRTSHSPLPSCSVPMLIQVGTTKFRGRYRGAAPQHWSFSSAHSTHQSLSAYARELYHDMLCRKAVILRSVSELDFKLLDSVECGQKLVIVIGP